mmetsp:Transcript_81206/g.143198  ORF Transcript_81206/g.143198 Transcript_81206/m.143198 type:complete len:88 (+) Transcript_81206:283-546(+)
MLRFSPTGSVADSDCVGCQEGSFFEVIQVANLTEPLAGFVTAGPSQLLAAKAEKALQAAEEAAHWPTPLSVLQRLPRCHLLRLHEVE